MDLIDRQAAIDILSLGKEILSRVLDDMDVVGTDREKYSWGLELIESNIKDIEELPSAQPQITHCAECMHWKHSDVRKNYCEVFDWMNKAEDFCSFVERRADE